MRSVYPNPFRNELKIKQLKNEFDFIEIYNLLGEKIYKQQLNLFTILNLKFLDFKKPLHFLMKITKIIHKFNLK